MLSQSRMLFDASRCTLLFVPLVLFVSLSIFLLPSRSFSRTIRHVYQRQPSVTTRFTFTTATLTDTVIISTSSHDQPEPLSHLSSTSSLSTSFRPTPPSSSALSTSSSVRSVKSSSPTSRHRESTSLTSRAPSITPETTISFLQPPVPVSTPHTTVSPPVSDSKVTSVLPAITSPASSNQDVPSPSFSAASAGTINSGFWSNKGAVGGTFAAVGLVALGIGAIFLVICRKKRRNGKTEEDLYSGFLHKGSSYDWPAQASNGLSRQPMDPFAAGDVVQIRGNSMPFMTASTSSGRGHANLEDNQTISDGHTSSNHGRISYPYSATYSDSLAYLNQPKPVSFQRPLWSPASASSLRTGLDLPPTHEPAVPVSPMSMASLSTIPSPYFDARRVDRRGPHLDSGASFYADQLHSYYYGESEESPSSARLFRNAF